MNIELVTCDACERTWEIGDEPACECPDDNDWYARWVEYDDD